MQMAITLHAKFVKNFAESRKDIAQSRQITSRRFGKRHASGAAACARADGPSFKHCD